MRISPICACSVCTARLISLALNSDALEWTVILTLPAVALSTSAPNCMMFSVWKLVAGYAVGMSHFVCAAAPPATHRPSATAVAWIGFIFGSPTFLRAGSHAAGGVMRRGGNGAFVPQLANGRRTARRPYNAVAACRFRRGPVPLPRHDPLAAGPLAILDRPRGYIHRYRRAPARRLAVDAQAAVREPGALPRRGRRRYPGIARRRTGCADSARGDRDGQDGHDRCHQRPARAQRRAHGPGDHSGLRRCPAHRLSEPSEALRTQDRAAEHALRARDRDRRARRRAW